MVFVKACHGNTAATKSKSACAPDSLEIYFGEVLLTKHPAQYRSGNVVFLPGQYSGLAEKGGVPIPPTYALQQQNSVEIRELSLYDQLLGGVSHG